ncbi:putative E3 ubiquitin-protein ligase RING1a [Durio zibethinus]|uniref:E3 ubiquitin-protein ligase RING1a n=1 Tax=Durio zibethinus TaxID=66656 RepID=A0A6P6AGU7_DURZI|nr:putative E3 ubiquitin-protein ligase RING1a [Durio zibethinus]
MPALFLQGMRLGNNECPACCTHCASRRSRSLRDDPNYDALITALYPDIDKYEEEELAFHEEERTCNKLWMNKVRQVCSNPTFVVSPVCQSSSYANTLLSRHHCELKK